MTLLHPRVASRVFGAPLMIGAGKAAAILAGIGADLVEGGVSIDGIAPVHHVAFANGRPSMGRLGDPMGTPNAAKDTYFQIGGLAIIPIEGTLIHKGKWLGTYSGETSYEGLQTQVAKAARDPSVRGVVFEIDSFGGEVAGAFDTAEMIAQLSAAKPTLAILTDFAFSAAYLLASAARQVVLPETGAAGSIGVISLHVDLTGAIEKSGKKVTVIASGKHKADGHPAKPLDADVLARMQSEVDGVRDIFAAAIGKYRGNRLDKEAALATEALDYRGVAAVNAGLADGVGRPTEMFERFLSLV